MALADLLRTVPPLDHRRHLGSGTWDRLLAHAQTKSDAVGEIDWVVSIDATIVRAHQHAAGARKRKGGRSLDQTNQPTRLDPIDDQGLGRSRGGLTTKVHLAADGHGRPLSIVITAGQRHESTQLGAVLDGIRVPRPHGHGRPRKRPDHVIADKGYSYTTCRGCCAGVGSATPSRSARTRSPAAGAARPRSTGTVIGSATWSSAASTGSSTPGRSPLATTSSPTATVPGLSLLPCWSGSHEPSDRT
jgi:transposase